jgi:hypothetical protein
MKGEPEVEEAQKSPRARSGFATATNYIVLWVVKGVKTQHLLIEPWMDRTRKLIMREKLRILISYGTLLFTTFLFEMILSTKTKFESLKFEIQIF